MVRRDENVCEVMGGWAWVCGDTRKGREESGAIDRARGVLVRSTPAALAHQPRNIYVYVRGCVNVGCSRHAEDLCSHESRREREAWPGSSFSH